MQRNLHIDIETFSSVPIGDCGAYKYAASPDFKILLIAYAYDDEPVKCIDLASGDNMPRGFLADLLDCNVLKHAHNAVFERVCFTMMLRRMQILNPDQWLSANSWRCSSVLAGMCGLPMSLKEAGKALNLTEQKMDEGKSLIQLFCTPRKTKSTETSMFADSIRVQPSEYPDKWDTFKAYCIRDVEVERNIEKALSWYNVPESEWDLYAVDQRINDRGVLIDMDMAAQANRMDAVSKARLSVEAATITGLANPNSNVQLKGWLSERLGITIDSLNKATLPGIVEAVKAQGDRQAYRVLQIRSEMAKTSNAKYEAMLNVAGADGRARGLQQFYGTRTGRWAGRLIQMQNLPQNHLEDLDLARQLLKEGDADGLAMCYGKVTDTMSQLIRTAFIPKEGDIFAVCDFSAIEARVLAWMAGEDWVLDTFRKDGDIYCATASQMFHKPVEKHGANSELRQRGKVAVLALGYGGGVNALDTMGGKRLGMTEDEEQDTVDMWRAANPHITAFWRAVETAARECVTYKTTRTVKTFYTTITFAWEGDGMTVELPSGRKLVYPAMELTFGKDWAATGKVNQVDDERFNVYEKKSKHPEKYCNDRGARLRFRGVDQETKTWGWIETWGGKLTENIVQAVARDCLAYTMTNCEQVGYRVVFHVHDELVMEVEDASNLKNIQGIFSMIPQWAQGLPLKGAGYTGNYYFKD